MTIEETYNIHKKINCTLPFFKSKWLCKKGIHNYMIFANKKDNYKMYWKCRCCGKIVKGDE